METVYLALRVLLALAVVLGLLWMVQRRLTRGGRMPGTAKQVNVVTRQVIAPKASVVVVDVDGQRFLLGVTEQSVTVLNTSDAPIADPVEAKPRRLAPAADEASGSRVIEAPATKAVAREAFRTHSTGGAAFARVLSDLVPSAPIAYLPRRDRRPASNLDGSILSPATWKRTAAAIRRIR